MDQLDAFLYFLVNLVLHNLVLVAVALVLGLVLGKLRWGKAKLGMDNLREQLKREETRVEDAEAALGNVHDEFDAFKAQVEAAGDGPVLIHSPELEEEAERLRKEAREHEELARKAAGDLENLTARVEAVEVEKEKLEEELAKQSDQDGGRQEELEKAGEEIARLQRAADEAREEFQVQVSEAGEKLTAKDKEIAQLREELKKVERRSEAARTRPALPPRGGRAVDLERAEAARASLQKDLEIAERERDQVEEASAILRKELYGLRSELEAAEKREALEGDFAAALRAAEAKVERLEGTVAKESRVRKELEKKLEEVVAAPVPVGGAGNAEAAHGAAADLRSSLEETAEDPAAIDDQPDEPDMTPAADAIQPRGGGEDDLKRIKGIGAVLEGKLKDRGVRTLRQIADWSDENLEEISEALNLGNRAERGDWRGQARELCGGD